MTEVVLFHHALGLTPGVTAFADQLRAAGHTVHVPDLFEGSTFDTIEAGVAHAERIGFGEVAQRGSNAVIDLPAELVYVGMSLGVLPAQRLAQTRAGALGAVLFYSCVPASEFGEWPATLAAQVHGAEHDPIFMGEGDVDAARELAATHGGVELFLYPAHEHYFADSTLPSFDADSAALALERTLDFLAAR